MLKYGLLRKQYSLFLVIFLFGGFILSGFFTYFMPFIRIISVIIILIYLSVNIYLNYLKSRNIFIFQIILLSYIMIQFYLNQIRDFDADLAMLLTMLFATLFLKNIKELIRILKFVIILNFIAMFFEVVSFSYIINIVEANKYEFGRMQGIFSYSKEAGYFLLIAFIFLRYFNISIFYKIILLLSSVMSGARTAIIAIIFILLVDYIYQAHRKLNFRNIFKQYLYFIVIIVLLISFSSYYFTDKTEYMLFRISSSFDFDSSSQQHRLYYWNFYFNSLNDYSLLDWLVGKGTYLNNLIGNGSENTYLMVISQIGLIGLFIFIIPFIMVIILLLKKPFKYYPFLILFVFLFVGRIGIGWADGILMWIMIYFIINKNYKYNVKMRKLNEH